MLIPIDDGFAPTTGVVETQPVYLGTIGGYRSTNGWLQWTQGVTPTAIDLRTHFSGNPTSFAIRTYTQTDGLSVPSDATTWGGIINTGCINDTGVPTGSGITGTWNFGTAPTTFQGWRRVIIRATNGAGSADAEFYLSVVPSTTNALGTAYTSTVSGTTQAGTSSVVANRVYNNVTFTSRVQLSNVTNVLFLNCRFEHNNQDDGLRLSTTGGCNNIIAYGCTASSNKDAMNFSGDWPAHGPNIYVMNCYMHDAGDNSDPKEHGFYIWTFAVIQGCTFYNNRFGNNISSRSSLFAECNFGDTAFDGMVSYYMQHIRSGSIPWLARYNVGANVGIGVSSAIIDLKAHDDQNQAPLSNRVNTFYIVKNRGSLVNENSSTQSLVDIASGDYTGVVTQSGNTTLASTAAARALYPPNPWV